ncbi:hypothetical protein J6590_022918 [Homalodisca vitripennis]|nr:hypothetical protein J6590_022918 [Homalodisca vitripennis]
MPQDTGKPPFNIKRASGPKYGGTMPDVDTNLPSWRSDLDTESNLPPILSLKKRYQPETDNVWCDILMVAAVPILPTQCTFFFVFFFF